VKKIYINGKFFCQQITGTQRYARELLNQLDELLAAEDDPKIAVEILVPKDARSIPHYKLLAVRTVGTMKGTKWEQLELPWYCRGQVLVTLSGGAPILHLRNVITIHDAAVFAAPRGYSLLYRLWYRYLYRSMAKKARHIFTVSNFSKSEIVKWCGADPEKMSVTYPGSEHFSRLAADASTLRRLGVTGKYVLAAGSMNPNKNFRRVVEAMIRIDAKDVGIVIAGGRDSKVFRQGTALPDRVRVLGYVNDAELKALYENAACFVFASLYEGFGLPPLEAISCGCPVVLSRVASLPEVFEGAADFCDPFRPDDIAAAIQRALKTQPGTAEELKALACKFSWEKCARETLKVLETI
jgi:glycosyltransferase involved in cell wall biosynthesis